MGVALCLCLGCVAAIALRLTCRDSLAAAAPFFYATPLALIWSGLALASGLFFGVRKSSLAVLAGVLAVACWGWWQETQMAAAAPASPGGLRVAFWNTARLNAGWPDVADQISLFSSPLMGFVEAGPCDPETRERWQDRFPRHRAIFFGNGLVLLAEGEILETSQGKLARGCYYGRATVQINGRRLMAFVVDIHSSPFYSREEALTTLTELAARSTDEPVVIMGDFNTPSDSVHFQSLRKHYENAFETAGRGNLATWPAPCPVLAIDHIWTSRRLAVHRAWHDSSLRSDHAAVIAELSFSK